MKALLHQMAPGVPTIDLFADAPAGNPKASAYLLVAYAQWFAAGTTFPCVVDPGVGGRARPSSEETQRGSLNFCSQQCQNREPEWTLATLNLRCVQ
jgi:S-adenosylmethionine hydrolase